MQKQKVNSRLKKRNNSGYIFSSSLFSRKNFLRKCKNVSFCRLKFFNKWSENIYSSCIINSVYINLDLHDVSYISSLKSALLFLVLLLLFLSHVFVQILGLSNFFSVSALIIHKQHIRRLQIFHDNH